MDDTISGMRGKKMNIQGLTSNEFKVLQELKVKANNEQLEAIINELVNEQNNRLTMQTMVV